AYSDQEGERLEAEALDFLHAASIGLDGVAVECAVRFGDPVTQILEEAEAWNADLIAMATRGRGCIERALMGSVAEQVFRKAPTAYSADRAHGARRGGGGLPRRVLPATAGPKVGAPATAFLGKLPLPPASKCRIMSAVTFPAFAFERPPVPEFKSSVLEEVQR